MSPISEISELAVPLALSNVDTDQIIPARFLHLRRSDGYGKHLFHDLRRSEDGAALPDFPLNRPIYSRAKILIAGRNFGCGSSREAAVYSLVDAGFRAVIAGGFGEIFFRNSVRNGMLAVCLTYEEIQKLWDAVARQPLAQIHIDLVGQTVRTVDGSVHGFHIPKGVKRALITGTDEIQRTVMMRDQIENFERDYRAEHSWLFTMHGESEIDGGDDRCR